MIIREFIYESKSIFTDKSKGKEGKILLYLGNKYLGQIDMNKLYRINKW